LPEKWFLKQGGRKNKPEKSFALPISSFPRLKNSFPLPEKWFFWVDFSFALEVLSRKFQGPRVVWGTVEEAF